ncbi:accessory gene regulator ArgB-like protein [Natroniella sp. ANB-PHB2]|uniref:accessory gene regulator ArgB-like protein n=1 Tax=Natroniella sp. ANB-PHB2 TaxID=3384444 RepID=UPI0038D47934
MRSISEGLIKKFFSDFKEEEQEVLEYGLTILLSTVSGYLLIFLVSSLFNVASLALTAAVTGGVIKIFAGGVHASCFRNCILTGTTVFTTIGVLAGYLGGEVSIMTGLFIFFVLVIGSLAIYRYAPAHVKEKPIKSNKRRFKFKIYSFVVFFVIMLFYFILYLNDYGSQVILAGLFAVLWQSFSLTPVAYSLRGRSYHGR